MGKRSANKKSDSSAANLGFEAKLSLTADKLRNNLGAAEYKHAIRVLVETLPPYKERVHDPCCGSAGMFVRSEESVEEESGGRMGNMAVYGQESNSTTRRLAMLIEYSKAVTVCDLKDEQLARRMP